VLLLNGKVVCVRQCGLASNSIRVDSKAKGVTKSESQMLAARGRSCHAESSVLKRVFMGKQRATTIVLVRFTADGSEAVSMPCCSCMGMLKIARKFGIKKVFANNGVDGYVRVDMDTDARPTRADRHLHE